MWRRGDAIVQQELWLGHLLAARPVTVAEDRSELLALYSHPRTPYRTAAIRSRYALPLAERVERMSRLPEDRLRHQFSPDAHVLTLNPSEAAHSFWLFWNADWTLRCWYVNLQAPLRRTALGICVVDRVLDIEVAPDLRWSWKDEDEFDALCRKGLLTPAEAAATRAEGKAVIERIERRASPFCDGWESFRADPEWSVPELPRGWDVVEAGT